MRITPRIVATGDSLIYGRNDSDRAGWIERLRSYLEKHDLWSAVFNLGIGGEDSRGLTKRIDGELKYRDPNAVIIGIGVNDARREDNLDGPFQIPIKEFEKNYKKIIKIIKKYNATVIISSVMPVDESRTKPLEGDYYVNEELRMYFDVQETLGKRFEAIFFNFWAIIENAGNEVYSDGLHLNSKGHELLFQSSKDSILNIFK